MQVHVVVGASQGCIESAQVFTNKDDADAAEVALKKELDIEDGAEAESECHTEVFYFVEIK